MSTSYDEIRKPPWAPPSWIFGVVWPVLYVLYILTGVVIFVQGRDTDLILATLYVAGWIINLLWIPLFRNRTNIWSPLWILLLLALTVALAFRLKEKFGAVWFLLLPYIVWLAFAATLGFAIWDLNN